MEAAFHIENTTRITPNANKKGTIILLCSIPEAIQGSWQTSSAGWGRIQFDAIVYLRRSNIALQSENKQILN